MTKHTEFWKEVDAIALALGVKPDALRKWRERDRVPYRWRLPLIEKSAGRITASDFLSREESAA